MKHTIALQFLAVGVIAVGMLASQTYDRASRGTAVPGPAGYMLSADGELFNGLDGVTTLTFMSAPAHVVRLGTSEFLICGRNTAGHGELQHWVKNGSGVYLAQSSYGRAGSDFVAVAYDGAAQQLYLLDGINQRIERAGWNGSSDLANTAWTTWAVSGNVPGLADAKDSIIYIQSASPLAMYLGQYMNTGEDGLLLTGSPVSSQPWNDTTGGLDSADVLAEQKTASEAGNVVLVGAPGGTQVQVVDMHDGAILGAGVVPANSQEVAVLLSSPMIIGKTYGAREVGESSDWLLGFVTMRRYGYPESLAGGVAMRRITHPLTLAIGSPEFAVQFGIHASAEVAQDVAYTGLMAVAVRTNGVDPVVAYGDNALLVTDYFVPASGSLRASDGQGGIMAPLPIPDDPGLGDTVVLVQFLIQDGSATRISEIVGMRIPPAAANGFNRGSNSGSRLESLLRGNKRIIRDASIVRRLLLSR